MARIQATATPRRSPVKIDGSAAGRTTYHSISSRFAPSILPTRTNTRCERATPAVALMTTGKNVPYAIRNTLAFGVNPKKTTESGTQATVGIGRNSWIGGGRERTRGPEETNQPPT